MQEQSDFLQLLRTGAPNHTMNIFDIKNFYRFFHFTCYECLLAKECEKHNHKQDNCAVCSNARKMLDVGVVARNNGFWSEDIYVNDIDEGTYEKIKKIIAYTQKHFQIKTK